MNSRYAVPAALIILFLALPAAGSAATRYAAPAGNGPEPCLQADPCGIHHAAKGHVTSDVVSGDEIVLLPGDYSVSQAIDLLDANLRFHGQAGQPRPRILSTGSVAVFTNAPGAQVSHIEIEQTDGNYGLWLSQGGTVDGVRVRTLGNTFSFTCTLMGTVTMRDSLCWSSGAAGAAVGTNTSGGSGVVKLRNVTAISTSPAPANSYGIFYGGSGASSVISVSAKSVIAKGVSSDVAASQSSGAAVTVDLDHSNYATEHESAGGATVTDPGTGTNQTAPPQFVDAANGDFHQAAGSPTIDAGAVDASSGSLDIDGRARIDGLGPDIGADEFVDPDDDNDGVADGSDSCPKGAGSGVDTDGDGCFDSEDADDDNDTVGDNGDNCPVEANGDQANNDGDGQGNVCDSDDDNDAVNDGADNCPSQAGPAGNTGCPEAARDTTPPDTSIATGPRKRSFSRRARFSLSSDDPGARFECSLDGAPFAPCQSSVDLRVRRGKHTFAARAIDLAGNVDDTPAAWRWKVKRRR